MRPRALRPGLGLAIAIGSLLVFGVCAVILHMDHWGDNPRYLSLYALRGDGFLWPMALHGLGIGSLALSIGIDGALPGTR